ncbi:MAG: lipocalin family protein [Pseudomonadota bacterium]|nr:lipocalin family protein [Pseudomonadota bacterium]
MRWILLIASFLMLQACQTVPEDPVKVASPFDLDRFMGDWYVIANIPTLPEKGAHNAVERYQRVGPNKVATTFTFRKNSFNGEFKQMTPTGFVSPENPAIWGMRFIWPFKADYRVLYVDEDYRYTVIGRQKRDYLWIMAREPQISEQTLEALKAVAVEQGYTLEDLKMVPQQPLDAR